MALRIFFLFISLCIAGLLSAQPAFRTVVSRSPVVVGESFQVQYIVEDGDRITGLQPPAFNGFRFVAGPNIYTGTVVTIDGIKSMHNEVFTLEAVKAGHFRISGATASNNGNAIRSNAVYIDVITKEEATKRFNRDVVSSNTDYYLRPGENPEEKIRKNLFLKVEVDRRSCFVGEPVLATFKLYSRLESRSDIIKNPGFYGFTVYDMINLSDRHVETEKLDGKVFDVHTIRKVQLYPLRPGEFVIDEMEVRNNVEFSRSNVSRKTEQQIIEGILGIEEESHSTGVEVFNSDMHTEPVRISVKPTPENKPVDYNGAVGRFHITANLQKNNIAKNEQGVLEIRVGGKGNFTQLSAPRINWPEGLEGFEPVVGDQLDKSTVPLTGERIFRYTFIATKAGNFVIPSTSLQFFDPDSGKYSYTYTPPISVHADDKEIKKENESPLRNVSVKKSPPKDILLISIGMIVIISLVVFINHRKKKPVAETRITVAPGKSVHDLLSPAYSLQHAADNQFYTLLHQGVWKFFNDRLQLQGSSSSRENLFSRLKEIPAAAGTIGEVKDILAILESGMYTSAALGINRTDLLERVRKLLMKLDKLF